MPKTVSVHNGSAANREHNRRNPRTTGQMPHIQQDLVHHNETWIDIPVREAYKQIFQTAVDDYNRRQSRPERKIRDYYNQIRKSAKKHTAYELIIQIGDKSNRISRAFDIFITITIVSNILVTFLQTFEELDFLSGFFFVVEVITLFIFCVEYVLRIWTADLLYPGMRKCRARLRFMVSFDGVVDILTIVPVFFLSGFVIFRMLRVARIFHLFRLNARYDSFNVITTVLYEKRNQIISSVFIVVILMLASSLCMYSVEHDSQPEVFRNAFSGIWWSMSTLLTVGYGDIYPITTLGRIMAICIAYLGVGAVAIPTGIISAGFVEQYQRKSSLSNIKEADIHEIAEIFVDKRFAGKSVEEMEEAEQVTIFLILREDLSILPQKDTILRLNDIIVIRGEHS